MFKPFSEFAPTGPDELFEEAELIDLFEVLKRVRRNAAPEDDSKEAGRAA